MNLPQWKRTTTTLLNAYALTPTPELKHALRRMFESYPIRIPSPMENTQAWTILEWLKHYLKKGDEKS
jgi:hypothetical protein